MMKTTIFTLTSARSGTLYLKHLFQRNIAGCDCRHEPFFDWGNPTMFGRVIEDASVGRLEPVRRLLARKRTYIERLPGSVYLESSHAFLKSAYAAALEFFPHLRLVHLLRDPVKVARSEAYREEWRRRVHAPFHYYQGSDGRPHFVWALTGNEDIYRWFEGMQLSLFQWYFIQWIEIENRAVRFVREHELADRCFALETPELNDRAKIAQLFQFFGLAPINGTVVLGGRKNRSLGYSAAQAADHERQCAALLERMPERYLEIFRRGPYAQYSWSARLRGHACKDDVKVC